jgi:hypothetical protein
MALPFAPLVFLIDSLGFSPEYFELMDWIIRFLP